jgi:hypothetical protein
LNVISHRFLLCTPLPVMYSHRPFHPSPFLVFSAGGRWKTTTPEKTKVSLHALPTLALPLPLLPSRPIPFTLLFPLCSIMLRSLFFYNCFVLFFCSFRLNISFRSFRSFCSLFCSVIQGAPALHSRQSSRRF